ncbi:hypothetical protein FR943_15710 [Mycobacterium sp. TNTM28]|uniref:Lipoprotein n=1 Tax=[Mycobacterium] fortunisiensis TaxID=2600579 RepID=A0ABS6KNU2_9MYCO|nr:hypothetical protein [[Mycobacterium] fortunisiensis]MBU9765285.1 hypothetical protein [[Mycobacterium] fortunisiensis]
MRPTLAALSILVAVGLSGCSTSTTEGQPAARDKVAATTNSIATPVATTVAPEVSPDEQCAGSKFDVAGFIGAWQDGPTVTTVSEHGSLKSDTNGDKQFGTWKFTQAGQTPAAAQVPVADTCVLWFHWMSEPPQDLFYVPLKVGATSLELSYVGRGNTITWERATAP